MAGCFSRYSPGFNRKDKIQLLSVQVFTVGAILQHLSEQTVTDKRPKIRDNALKTGIVWILSVTQVDHNSVR